ncbi:hypothetical protein B0H14DRAFT_2620880 [Mycena olivaceomarginata]|nr:hypothetical protein B0H14DRAFT_2620880 [Mycena olivaceomarginata]
MHSDTSNEQILDSDSSSNSEAVSCIYPPAESDISPDYQNNWGPYHCEYPAPNRLGLSVLFNHYHSSVLKSTRSDSFMEEANEIWARSTTRGSTLFTQMNEVGSALCQLEPADRGQWHLLNTELAVADCDPDAYTRNMDSLLVGGTCAAWITAPKRPSLALGYVCLQTLKLQPVLTKDQIIYLRSIMGHGVYLTTENTHLVEYMCAASILRVTSGPDACLFVSDCQPPELRGDPVDVAMDTAADKPVPCIQIDTPLSPPDLAVHSQDEVLMSDVVLGLATPVSTQPRNHNQPPSGHASIPGKLLATQSRPESNEQQILGSSEDAHRPSQRNPRATNRAGASGLGPAQPHSNAGHSLVPSCLIFIGNMSSPEAPQFGSATS